MHPIENIIDASMEQIKKLVDVNTVIGSPVHVDEKTTIIPVSRVGLGFVIGGGEYGRMANVKKAACVLNETNSENRFPFAGTAAVGLGLTPLSFIAVENGDVRVLPAEQNCVADRLMDLMPRVLNCLETFMKEGINCIKQKSKTNKDEITESC